MKRSRFWFMVEGIVCGLLQVLLLEVAVSVYAQPWSVITACTAGLLCSVGFFLLMRRYPALKAAKFALGIFASAVILPAWFVYRNVFSLALFPPRMLAGGDGTGLLQLLGMYAAAVTAVRIGIIIGFAVRRHRRRKAKRAAN